MKILSKTGQSNLKKLNEQFERVVCMMSKTLRFNTINSTLREVNTEYTNKVHQSLQQIKFSIIMASISSKEN